jgi:hypothetical protein
MIDVGAREVCCAGWRRHATGTRKMTDRVGCRDGGASVVARGFAAGVLIAAPVFAGVARGEGATFGEPAWLETPAVVSALRASAGLSAGDAATGAERVVAVLGARDSFVVLGRDAEGGAALSAEHPAGFAPNDALLRDLDADGDVDLLVLSPSTDRLRMVWNRAEGEGGFELGAVYSVGRSPLAAAAGRFDGDDAIDFATANRFDHALRLGFGDGATSWTLAGSEVSTGLSPHDVEAGDINGDGGLDLVVAATDADAIVVHLGDGVGGFAAGAVFATGAGPSELVLGDLDGDGDLDVVVLESAWSQVTAFANDGNGGLSPAFTVSAGLSSRGLGLADLDDDGYDDVFWTNGVADGRVVVLRNAPAPTVRSLEASSFDRTELALPFKPKVTAAADLDGDFLPELVVAEQGVGRVWVYPNETPREPSACPGDVDGDGRVTGPDLLGVLARFGARDATRRGGDVTGDGKVDGEDLLTVLGHFGAVCEAS